MFRLDGGSILALYPRSELAKDAKIPPGPARSGEFSLGHLVRSRAGVDKLLAQAAAAGATVSDLLLGGVGNLGEDPREDVDGQRGRWADYDESPAPAGLSSFRRVRTATLNGFLTKLQCGDL